MGQRVSAAGSPLLASLRTPTTTATKLAHSLSCSSAHPLAPPTITAVRNTTNMATMRSLVLVLATLLLAGAAAAAPACPITAEAVAKADFSGIKAACPMGAPQAKLCSDCICALVQAFTPVLQASGIATDGASGLTREQATSYISACLGLVLPPLQRAGVALSALMQLTSCPSTPVPSCLAGVATP